MGDSPIIPAVQSEGWLIGNRVLTEPALRLFCFPYAGGGASMFASWSTRLPKGVEVVPLQLPGRENHWKKAPFTEIGPLLNAVVQVLEPLLNVPFALFGHSMGGLIGFEVARELRKRGTRGPICLFVSGARAPQLPSPDPPISQLPEEEFLEELSARYGAADPWPDDGELRRLVVPLLRADLSLCETYVYSEGPPLECPIAAFGGLEDPRITRDELAAWRSQTRGPFSLRVFPGGHFYLQSSPESFLRVLSHQVHQILRRLRRQWQENRGSRGGFQ